MGLSHMTLEYVGISCRLQWGHGGTDKGGVGSTGQSPTTEIGGSMSYTSSRGFLGCSSEEPPGDVSCQGLGGCRCGNLGYGKLHHVGNTGSDS